MTDKEFYEEVFGFDASEKYKAKRFSEVEHSLKQFIAKAIGQEQVAVARSSLVNHYHFVEDYESALSLLHEQLREYPSDWLALIGLTSHFHYYQVDLTEAAAAVEAALAQATRQQSFVRQTLGDRMRIALLNADFGLATATLEQLIAYSPPADSIDVAYEGDFIKDIPHGMIDRFLVARYEALISRGAE